MFLNFYDLEPRFILKLFLNIKDVPCPKSLRNIFQFFYALLYHKTKQNYICIDNAKE